MKIAIHHNEDSYSITWVNYCKEYNIPCKIVNCYDSDIVEQLNDCDALLWHHHHVDYRDKLFAQQLLFALQQAGMVVYPDFNTSWHFDDKVGQKYLLEALKVPAVPGYTFYSKSEAHKWVKNTTFPKVFKLRGGAGASNVRLVKNTRTARRLIHKAFNKGFSQFNRWGYLRDRWKKMKEGKDTFSGVLKGIARLFVVTEFAKMAGREKGYVYFQDFIENDGFDVRVVVIDGKAASLKRLVRKNDFRASGSNKIVFENKNADKRYIKTAFDLTARLRSQSLSIDFIVSTNNEDIYIVEVSYASPVHNIIRSEGYWDNRLNWVKKEFNPPVLILEQIISTLKHRDADS